MNIYKTFYVIWVQVYHVEFRNKNGVNKISVKKGFD